MSLHLRWFMAFPLGKSTGGQTLAGGRAPGLCMIDSLAEQVAAQWEASPNLTLPLPKSLPGANVHELLKPPGEYFTLRDIEEVSAGCSVGQQARAVFQEQSPSPLFHAGPGTAQALSVLHHPRGVLHGGATAAGGAGRVVSPVSARRAPAGAGSTPRLPLGIGALEFKCPRLSSGSVVLEAVGASETRGLGGTGMPGLEEEGWQEEVVGTPG